MNAALGIGQARPAESPPPRAAGDDPRFRKEWWGEPVEFGKAVTLRAISSDGRRAVVGHNLGLVCVDLQNPKILWYHELKDHILPRSAAFSPDGKLLATAEFEHGANIFDAETGTPIELFAVRGESGERPYQVEFLPDGKLVVLAARQFTTPDREKPPPPAGTWVPYNTLSYTAVVWDPAAKKDVRRTHEELAYGDAPIRAKLVAGGRFIELSRVWNENSRPAKQTVRYVTVSAGKTVAEFELDKHDRTYGLTADGKTLLAMVSGEAPRLIDTTTGKTLRSFEGHIRPVTDAALSPDGKLVAGVSGGYPDRFSELFPEGRLPDGPAEVFLWEVGTGRQIARYQFPSTNGFNTSQFSPDGNYLAVVTGWAGGDRTIALGQLPFPRPKKGEHVGIPNLPMPQPKPAPPAAALPPTPAVVPPPANGGFVADALDKLAEDLPKSGRPAAQQIDALFLAALGRLPTAAEAKKLADTYKNRLAADVLRKILAELAASPEFEAHVKTLDKRLETKKAQPFRWEGGPGFPGAFPAPYGMPLQFTFPNVLPPPQPKKP